jgi:type II secretory ATPase GspE/PulE/Tfp pilus assembly ATPase PilB-like protein
MLGFDVLRDTFYLPHLHEGHARMSNSIIQLKESAGSGSSGFANIPDTIGHSGIQKHTSAASSTPGIEHVDLHANAIPPQAIRLLTANIATHYQIAPYSISDDALTIAISDPLKRNLKQELSVVIGSSLDLEFVLASPDAIASTIRKLYGMGAATVEQMVNTDQVHTKDTPALDVADETHAREASVIKLVNQLLDDAIRIHATDIHIEPYEQDIKVKYRIDGVLIDAGMPQSIRYFKDGLVSRIKIMSGLDIAEKRLPQDGRTQIAINGLKYDLRISVLPTRFGEAVNIRILPQGTLIMDLPHLGMPETVTLRLRKLINKPHGILLVTGPTGSGKTTTLYTCMNLLKDSDRKIITVEDPIEYDMPGILQMQVHPAIGFTFGKALRAMLRHDPDIMLVGEIRDVETAETAIRTALTGHLVFSTLHTNDAGSTITRLLDMGIEPYLVASSLEAILAQRLVRRICPACKASWIPDPDMVTAIKAMSKLDELPQVFKGKGCAACRFTGYSGRTVVTELMILSETIRDMTVAKRHANDIENQATSEGMQSLFDSALSKAHEGITTYEEVLRVSKDII